jgi:hypothetical protein
VEQYQNALRNIKYENTNIYNPTAGTRTITFHASDAEKSSNNASRNISVIHINKAPSIANIESGNLVYLFPAVPREITNTITVSDIDNSQLSAAYIQITEGYKINEDVLTFTKTENIEAKWDQAAGKLILSGQSSISNYQKALHNVKYLNLLGNNPSLDRRVISISVNDGELTSGILQRMISFNAQPQVTNLRIEGEMTVCKTLTGKYTYEDNENDPESHSTMRWLRADSPDGIRTPVPEATSFTYVLTSADKDKYLFFEVTPQAQTGSIQGNPRVSEATIKIPDNLPKAVFSGSATICEGTTTNVTVVFTGKPPFTLTYTDGTIQSILNTSETIYQIAVSRAGVYRGILLTDHLNCEVTDLPTSATIITKPSPHAEIQGLKAAYSLRGAPVPLQGIPSGGIFQGKGVVAANNTFFPSLAGLEGSPHPITYTYVDPVSGCYDSDTVLVEIIDAEASISGLRQQNQYCTIDVPAILTGTNVAGTTGNFSISGGKGLTDHGDNTATLDPTRLLPGNYTISYSYIQNGTLQTIYRDIDVIRVDNVIISGLGNSVYCSGADSLPISSNYPLGLFEGSGIRTYNGGFYFHPRNATTGLNDIIFKFKTDFGCMITDTLTIRILASSRPSFQTGSSCWNESKTSFLNTTVHPDSVKSWKWMFGDNSGKESTLKNPEYQYATPGEYHVKLIATNLNNCTDTISQMIHLGESPLADFSWEKECTNEHESLHIRNMSVSEDSIKSYKWLIQDSSGNVQTFSTQDITSKFNWNETYQVKLNLQTIYGCKDSLIKNLTPGAPYSLKDSSYFESFENRSSWNIESVADENWKWQIPSGAIGSAHSGEKAMFTKYTAEKSPRLMVITSPCFDFTGIERPFIQLWINSAVQSNQEHALLQYKTDSGAWTTLGNTGSGINWYTSLPDLNSDSGWTGNSGGWIKAANVLDKLAGMKNIKFRMIFRPAGDGNSTNMFAFDDVFVGERQRQSLFENFTNLSALSAFTSIT